MPESNLERVQEYLDSPRFKGGHEGSIKEVLKRLFQVLSRDNRMSIEDVLYIIQNEGDFHDRI